MAPPPITAERWAGTRILTITASTQAPFLGIERDRMYIAQVLDDHTVGDLPDLPIAPLKTVRVAGIQDGDVLAAIAASHLHGDRDTFSDRQIIETTAPEVVTHAHERDPPRRRVHVKVKKLAGSPTAGAGAPAASHRKPGPTEQGRRRHPLHERGRQQAGLCGNFARRGGDHVRRIGARVLFYDRRTARINRP